MTREERAFLDAICEAPHDDVPRLVYADWLEDRGRLDRAEFIRVQCELAALDPYHRSCTGARCPGCSALRCREDKLMAPGRQWRSDYGEVPVGQTEMAKGLLSYGLARDAVADLGHACLKLGRSRAKEYRP